MSVDCCRLIKLSATEILKTHFKFSGWIRNQYVMHTYDFHILFTYKYENNIFFTLNLPMSECAKQKHGIIKITRQKCNDTSMMALND